MFCARAVEVKIPNAVVSKKILITFIASRTLLGFMRHSFTLVQGAFATLALSTTMYGYVALDFARSARTSAAR